MNIRELSKNCHKIVVQISFLNLKQIHSLGMLKPFKSLILKLFFVFVFLAFLQSCFTESEIDK